MEFDLMKILDVEHGKKRTFEDLEEEIINKRTKLEQVPPMVFETLELGFSFSLGGIEFTNVKYDGGSSDSVLPLSYYQFLGFEGLQLFYPEQSPST